LAKESKRQPNEGVNLVNTNGSDQTGVTQCFKTKSQLKGIDPRYLPHCVSATINCRDSSTKRITLLRDTGALQSLLNHLALSDNDYLSTGETRIIRGVSGQELAIPLVEVNLSSDYCNGTFLCGLANNLPTGIDGLLGNDLCPGPSVSDSSVIDNCVVTRAQSAASKATATQLQSTVELSADVSPNAPDNDTIEDLGLSNLFQDPSLQGLDVHAVSGREQLFRLQQDDPDLSILFEHCSDQSEDLVSGECFMQSGILMRYWQDDVCPAGTGYSQIVAPSSVRRHLLHIAHDIPASGHLGISKTKNRLIRHFWWPSLLKDVTEYCRTCDVCQRLGKGAKKVVAPLHSLPLVQEPFTQVAIDIIGPLPICKETQNRFVLTILDLCTHYPEAIPLKQHTARDVAQALTSVFSRFGFPQEILSDLGSDFQSELMQLYLHEFNVGQIRCSAYHPETNGACERFNGTFKNMIKALVDQYDDAWDACIPWVLFAYREVPVETLGCSPFELMFGRTVQGPLSLIKNAWLQEVDLSSAKKSVVEFMLATRERLRSALAFAHSHAEQQRTKAKTWYDKKARTRIFEPGDKVLFFYPCRVRPHRPNIMARMTSLNGWVPLIMWLPRPIDEKVVGFVM
jgi:transposase InsO family protein